MTEKTQVFLGAELGLERAFRLAGVKEIYVQGDVTALELPLLALVGTRHPNGDGLELARALTACSLARGYVPISGGALGIDAAVHLAALAMAERTVVVLPSGLTKPYPVRHKPMYDRVVANGGALVSPFRADTPPSPWTFAKRNGLVAALCRLMVVVQAPAQSGSLIAATMAMKMGRRVLAVPSAPNDRRGAGCLGLLRQGAELCAGPEDLAHALDRADGPLLPSAAVIPSSRRVPQAQKHHAKLAPPRPASGNVASPRSALDEGSLGLDLAQRACLTALSEGPCHPDALSKLTQLDAAAVRSALMTLVILGVVHERTDGRFATSV
jgi:DNA processing protein